MSLAAKWRNRAADRLTPATDSIRNIRTIRTIPPQTNSANTANYANAIPPPALSTDGVPSGLPVHLCLGCGNPFTPSDENKVYCRAKCFSTMRGVLQ